MPRLSLYRPEKGNDYKFIDKTVYEQFQVGGTDVFFHKYLGPADPANPNKATTVTTIQDVLFLENRDRKYDPTIYSLRGIYTIQDIDYFLSQFGSFVHNDVIYMTVHINNSVETVGRKIISGDVIELPHLKDDFAGNDFAYSLKRFYVVEDITRAAEGFSATWYPHLYRLKLKPIVDSQEFKDILDLPQNTDSFAGDYDETKTYYPGQVVKSNGKLYTVIQETTGTSPPNETFFSAQDSSTNLRDMMSTFNIEQLINESVVAAAESDAPSAGYSTNNYYTLALDEKGKSALVTVDDSDIHIDDADYADAQNKSPVKPGYKGYLVGQGIPPNGMPFGFGIEFPEHPGSGDFFLRTDYLPNRMFRYTGSRWTKYEDDIKMTLSNTDSKATQKTGFINNKNVTGLRPIVRDVFTLTPGHVFRPDDPTSSVNLSTGMVITRTAYNPAYTISVFVNQHVMGLANGLIDQGGFCAFQTEFELLQGDSVKWTIYKESIPERQALSKALLPRADF